MSSVDHINNNNNKSNRISDDSGVVCFNTSDELTMSSSSSYCSYSSASAMFLQGERSDPNGNHSNNKESKSHKPNTCDSLGNDLFAYKSVYNRNTSFEAPDSIVTCTPSAIKRREKRGNYVIGSGIVAEEGNTSLQESSSREGKYVSKRLTHVQQMRMRFENWCHLNEEKKRCEAVHCKGSIRGDVPQFDSLPIIPFQKTNSDKTSPSSVESSPGLLIGEVIATGLDKEEVEEEEEGDSDNPDQLNCGCADGDDKEQIEFRENGK